MPKRRRHTNSVTSDNNSTPDKNARDLIKDTDVRMARGRLKGALQDAMDSNAEDTDSSLDHTPVKTERNADSKQLPSVKRDLSDELQSELGDTPSERGDRRGYRKKVLTPHKNNSYVMKLFDRSVDLAQFKEDTPLYPICRAWMANQPRNNFRPKSPVSLNDDDIDGGVELPGPEGPPVPRVPPLLIEQFTRSKNNINLNYNEKQPISKEVLMAGHMKRWNNVRKKWLEQAVKYEARYARTQELLNEMDTNS